MLSCKNKHLGKTTLNILLMALLLVTIFQNLISVLAYVPMTEFLPYSEESGATRWNYTLDSLNLGFSFKYFEAEYNSAFIRSHGIVTFNKGVSDMNIGNWDTCRSSHKTPIIMPFWVGFIRQNTEKITYFLTSNQTLLEGLSGDISFAGKKLTLTNALAVTWVKAAWSSGYESTFQVILTTDGIHSFVLFYYNQIKIPDIWVSTAGFIDNSGKNVYLIRDSCTTNIDDVVVQESNVCAPGKWVFQVDSIDNFEAKPTMYLEKTQKTKTRLKSEASEGGIIYFKLKQSQCTKNFIKANVDCHYGNNSEISTMGIMLPTQFGLVCPVPAMSIFGETKIRVDVRLEFRNSTTKTLTHNTTIFISENANLTNSSDISLQIQPTFISVFGNVPLFLNVSTIEKAPVSTKCKFIESNNMIKTSKGVVLSQRKHQVICPVPFLSTVGVVHIELQLDYREYPSEVYTGRIYAAREQDCNGEDFVQIQAENSTNDKNITLKINLGSDQSIFAQPEVLEYFDISQKTSHFVIYSYDGNAWSEVFAGLVSSEVNRTVKSKVSKQEYFEVLGSSSLLAVGIRETFHSFLGKTVSIVRFQRIKDTVLFTKSLKAKENGFNFTARCMDWLESEEYFTKPTVPCPQTISEATQDWKFVQNDANVSLEINDKNKFSFSQAVPTVSGKGVHCLYDTNGNLSSQSHVQRFAPTNHISYWNHYWHDAVPFTDCCNLSENEANCKENYFTKRAKENGLNYVPPKFALMTSTGKIFPFEGKTRRISSVGEFWAVKYTIKLPLNRNDKYTSFKMQVRIEQYSSADCKPRSIPVVTSIAILDRTQNRNFGLQIHRNENEFVVQVNSKEEPYQLFILPGRERNQTFYLDQATVQYIPFSGKFMATFQSGFSVMASLAGDDEIGMNIIVSATENQIQNSFGLLVGKPINRVMEANLIEGSMGTEMVYKNESIFVYSVDKPYQFYHRSNVTLQIPSIIESQPRMPTIPFVEGVLDFMLTGSESIGNSTRVIHELFEGVYKADFVEN